MLLFPLIEMRWRMVLFGFPDLYLPKSVYSHELCWGVAFGIRRPPWKHKDWLWGDEIVP